MLCDSTPSELARDGHRTNARGMKCSGARWKMPRPLAPTRPLPEVLTIRGRASDTERPPAFTPAEIDTFSPTVQTLFDQDANELSPRVGPGRRDTPAEMRWQKSDEGGDA